MRHTQGPTHHARRVCREVAQNMSKDRNVIVQESFATVVAGVLCWQAMQLGFPVTAALLSIGIGVINGFTLQDVAQAARKRRARDRQQQPLGEDDG